MALLYSEYISGDILAQLSTIDSVELIFVATNQCRFVPYIPLTLQHISAAAGIGERIRCVVIIGASLAS